VNSTAKGNAFELAVSKAMEAMGFVVASRRHVGGAGDLLGVHPDGRIWLVEVKNCKNVYAGFRREDRKAMSETVLPAGAERFLASKDGNVIKWTSEADWP
jgi:hypothetical protein